MGYVIAAMAGIAFGQLLIALYLAGRRWKDRRREARWQAGYSRRCVQAHADRDLYDRVMGEGSYDRVMGVRQ